ncbi:MAG: SAM-dependent chlorinase/fluorinase [Bryobacter sp.]|nr:SAM-dependent chlorinase/fluorinase [Bryobacter sp.]
MPKRPLITLTTDFGTRDHFAGVMRGVIASLAPAARVIDITHEISSHDVNEGAFTIAESWSWFPKGTIHVVVVDPGVGSERRPLLAQAGGHTFVGPDNGIFSLVFEKHPPKVRALTNEKFFLKPVSRTFHGRDIFSPVAAHLARGVPPSRFGKLIEDYLKPLSLKPQRLGRRIWCGQILKVDRFGNCITCFHVDEFPELTSKAFDCQIGAVTFCRMAENYTAAPFGEPFGIIGSSGYLEISLHQAHAAQALGVTSGSPVEITFAP